MKWGYIWFLAPLSVCPSVCTSRVRFRSISLTPGEIYKINNFAQMSSTMRRCAVPMFDQGRFKVNVKINPLSHVPHGVFITFCLVVVFISTSVSFALSLKIFGGDFPMYDILILPWCATLVLPFLLSCSTKLRIDFLLY